MTRRSESWALAASNSKRDSIQWMILKNGVNLAHTGAFLELFAGEKMRARLPPTCGSPLPRRRYESGTRTGSPSSARTWTRASPARKMWLSIFSAYGIPSNDFSQLNQSNKVSNRYFSSSAYRTLAHQSRYLEGGIEILRVLGRVHHVRVNAASGKDMKVRRSKISISCRRQIWMTRCEAQSSLMGISSNCSKKLADFLQIEQNDLYRDQLHPTLIDSSNRL